MIKKMTSNICRLCLNDQQLVYSVFKHNVKELSKTILRCTSVEILQNDGLPNGACMKCIEMVTQFDSFRKQCQYSDSILKEKYTNGTNIKSETSTTNSAEEKFCKSEEFESSTETCIKIRHMLKAKTKHKTVHRDLRSNSRKEENSRGISEMFNSSNCNDVDNASNSIEANLSNNACNQLDGDKTIVSSFDPPKIIAVKKKKCKIKFNIHLTKKMQEMRDNRPHLVYTEQDYAILGRERKVRIWEIDDTMRAIIGNNVYVCEICAVEFTSFFDYYDHQEAHNGEPVFKCSKCNEIFQTRQSLVEHDSRHKIPCSICDLEVLPKSMPAHLLIHTDIHKCPDCGMRHTSNASLEKHIKARHTGIKGFVCHICGKQSSCQSSMNRHMAYHSSERPYKCKYCDFCAKSLNIVQVHTSRKHFAEKCVCEICAKLFKSQPSLIQHMKRIHTDRRHVCDICGKAFIERYNLNRHLKRHAGQRLHECKLCHKEFFTIRKLKEHMHSHRQGCVNCPKCGKEFFYKKYYSKHVLKCTKTDNINGTVASN